MYIVCWTENIGRGRTRNTWESCRDRDATIRCVTDNNLENDMDAMIFTPESDDYVITPAELLRGGG